MAEGFTKRTGVYLDGATISCTRNVAWAPIDLPSPRWQLSFMKLDEILTLMAYDQWATDRTLDAVSSVPVQEYLQDLKSSHGGIHGTLVHVYSSNMVWYARWKGGAPTGHIDKKEIPDLQSLKRLWRDYQDGLNSYLGMLDDAKLAAPLDYKDLKGKPHSEPLFQQMQHLVNHGSYHRGQVVTMLRQIGAVPNATDLIAFFRGLQVEPPRN